MILTGHREAVRDWICDKIRDIHTKPERDYEALGVARDGRIIGGVLYTEWRELVPGQHDIFLTAAGEPGWLSKGIIRELLRYPFVQLRCIRITSVISKANKPARAFNEKLGFKLEGTVRHGRGVGKDCVIYGLLKSDAERWLK